MLRVDAIGALATLGLEGLDGVTGLLHRASHEAADRVALPSHLAHDLRQRGPVLPLQHGDHLSRFAALPGADCALAGFAARFPLGARLTVVA
jgi:hypothetical protein